MHVLRHGGHARNGLAGLDFKGRVVNGHKILDDLNAATAFDGRCVQRVQYVAVLLGLFVQCDHACTGQIGYKGLAVTQKGSDGAQYNFFENDAALIGIA